MIDKDILSQITVDKQKKYFLFDVGAFIIPYIRYNLYTYNRTNITPFIKLVEMYFSLTNHVKNYQCFFFIDNGVPKKIEDMYSAYKGNRRHSRHKNESKIISRDILKSNEYVVNRTLITQFFTYLGEGVFYFTEADYQLGYVLKRLIESFKLDGSNCYVISHDKDLMALIGHCNCIRKLIQPKQKYTKFWLFKKGDYQSYIGKDEHVYSYTEFIVKKALQGDRGDNILAPIMCTESFVKKLFSEYKFNYGYYELDLEKTFEIIKDKLVNKKIKKTDTTTNRELIEERLAIEFRRNYLIFDVYNCEGLLTPVDKRFLDVILNNIMNGNLKRNFNDAYNVINKVSNSHGEIFKKWTDTLHRT